MKLFFAMPRYDVTETLEEGFRNGVRNALVSYANVKEKNGRMFHFWLNKARDSAKEMKLFLAGNAGLLRLEQEAHEHGCLNRMVTFADTMQRNHSCCPKFWIEGRAQAMKAYFAVPNNCAEQLLDIEAAGAVNQLVSYAANDTTKRTLIEARTAMKLYIAGNGKSKGSAQRDLDTGTRNRLLSYAFLKDWAKDEFEFWIHNRPQQVCVFLDSGAFSAFTLGRVIDLGEYCSYVEENQEALHAYAVLDVIGDAAATMVNLRIMQQRGLRPVPIYHSGREDSDVLRRVIGESSGQIAIGGMATLNLTKRQLQERLDEYWDVIGKYWPIKVHGLGLMAQWALERYPFYSVDSSSAILGAGMGRVSRFTNGILTANGWVDDLGATWDGVVADGVGRNDGGKSKSAHEGRRMRNIQAQLATERYVTDLWKARGVEWQE